MASTSQLDADEVTLARVVRVWWPLAASWLLMGAEGPVVTSFIARTGASEVHLAAFSAAFNVSLVVEAPIIMLLAASTALATSQQAYWRLHRYMVVASALLTALHALIAFTPVFGFVATTLLEVPEPALEPMRLGLQLLLPWTAAIAYRRFQQGVLIRTEHSTLVLIGTVLRLVVGLSTISFGYARGWDGIALGATTLSAGVLVEAVFAWFAVRGPRTTELPEFDPEDAEPVRLWPFLQFYFPLAMTPLLILGVQPFGTATMSRMPFALESLASYHAVHSLVFLMRSAGFALNEVVVTLLGRPGAVDVLVRFSKWLALILVGALAAFALTPLGAWWFETVQGFKPELVDLAAGALVFALLMPLNQVLQSWYGGVLLKSGRTRGITEAVALYGVVALGSLWAGVAFQPTDGLTWTLGSLTLAGLVQAVWLAVRAQPSLQRFRDPR